MWLTRGYFYVAVKFLLIRAFFSWWNRALQKLVSFLPSKWACIVSSSLFWFLGGHIPNIRSWICHWQSMNPRIRDTKSTNTWQLTTPFSSEFMSLRIRECGTISLHQCRYVLLWHKMVTFFDGGEVDTKIMKNEHNKLANMENSNIDLRIFPLSAIAPNITFTNKAHKAMDVNMHPTVMAEYPICLAMVEPNVIRGAIPTTQDRSEKCKISKDIREE